MSTTARSERGRPSARTAPRPTPEDATCRRRWSANVGPAVAHRPSPIRRVGAVIHYHHRTRTRHDARPDCLPEMQEPLDIPSVYHGRQVRCASCQSVFVASRMTTHQRKVPRVNPVGRTTNTTTTTPNPAAIRRGRAVVSGVHRVRRRRVLRRTQPHPADADEPDPSPVHLRRGKFKVDFPGETPTAGADCRCRREGGRRTRLAGDGHPRVARRSGTRAVLRPEKRSGGGSCRAGGADESGGSRTADD